MLELLFMMAIAPRATWVVVGKRCTAVEVLCEEKRQLAEQTESEHCQFTRGPALHYISSIYSTFTLT